MFFSKPETEEEEQQMRRAIYEHEKEETEECAKRLGVSATPEFLRNNLLRLGYNYYDFLVEDGFIAKETAGKLYELDDIEREKFIAELQRS